MRQFNRLNLWVVCLLLLFWAWGKGEQEVEILLLHTNDSHGSVLAVDSVGGLAERATYIQGERAAHRNVLLVDAGDFNTGQPVSNLSDARADILAYNWMGYDAITLGNHEFDKPVSVLLQQMEWAKFPFLTSNVEQNGGSLGESYIIKEYGGLKIGLFGITTTTTPEVSTYGKEMVFKDAIATAREMVETLKAKGVDLIVALTHLGFVEETEIFVTSTKLARQVEGIDIIVDGHSHSYIDTPVQEKGTWIVSAASNGKYVGRGLLTVKNGKLKCFDWRPVLIKGFRADTAVMALLQPFLEIVDADLNTEIGIASEAIPLVRNEVNLARMGEHPLGNLVTDALCWKAREEFGRQIDFCVVNAGMIRAGFLQGVITKNDVLTMLPFGNVLGFATMTGAEVKRLFDFFATVESGDGSFPQVSGLQVEFDVPTKKVLSLMIQGKPVVDTARYQVATTDYLLKGNDGYAVFNTVSSKEQTERVVADIVIEYIRELQILVPKIEGRITRRVE